MTPGLVGPSRRSARGELATREIGLELLGDCPGQTHVGFLEVAQEGREVLADRSMEEGLFGFPTTVGRRLRGLRTEHAHERATAVPGEPEERSASARPATSGFPTMVRLSDFLGRSELGSVEARRLGSVCAEPSLAAPEHREHRVDRPACAIRVRAPRAAILHDAARDSAAQLADALESPGQGGGGALFVICDQFETLFHVVPSFTMFPLAHASRRCCTPVIERPAPKVC